MSPSLPWTMFAAARKPKRRRRNRADRRMRCLEFLYFYLLPEQTTPASDDPSLRSASGSSATTASSEPYPPSPLSTTSRIEDSRDLLARHSVSREFDEPSSAFLAQSRMSSQPAFIPQTPKKKSQPALGFATPSAHAHARKSSGSNISAIGYGQAGAGVTASGSAASRRSITPTLETVPPSPEVFVQARQVNDASTSETSRDLGTPIRKGGSTGSKGSSELRRSSTMVDLSAMGDGNGDRRVTAIHQKRTSDAHASKPPTPARRSMPPPASPARFLQASDAPPVPSTPRRSSGDSASTPRRSSTMQALDQAGSSRTQPSQRAPTASTNVFKIPSTPSSTPAGLPSAPATPKSSKAPRIRHSLAPSHTYTSLSTAGAPPVPLVKTPSSSRTGSRGSDAEGARTPSRMKRSETGLPPVSRVPPSPSMGALGLGRGVPLRESRRAVSRGNSGHESEGGLRGVRGESGSKGLKSVQEKKDMVRDDSFFGPEQMSRKE